jgi:hypothetical protein
MPRYYFIIAYPDQEIGDPYGTLLPNDATSIEYARRVINDLREDLRPEDPAPAIVVKNAAGEVVFRFPNN